MAESFDSPSIWAPSAPSPWPYPGPGPDRLAQGQVGWTRAAAGRSPAICGPSSPGAGESEGVLANLGGDLGDMISLPITPPNIDQFMRGRSAAAISPRLIR